jgi:hypothetical protein
MKENEQADVNITLSQTNDLDQQAELLTESRSINNEFSSRCNEQISLFSFSILELQTSLNGESVEAILNVAGGWAGGNASDKGKHRFNRSNYT